MAVRPHPTKSKMEPGKHWYIDIGRGKDRQRLLYSGSYEDAVEIERSLRQSPEHIVPVVAKISELVVPFLEYYQTVAADSTVKDVNWVIEGHLIHYFGPLQPRQITPAIIDKYKRLCLDKGLSKRSINKHLSYLSSLVKWGVEMNHCQPFPFRIALFPARQTKADPIKPLTKSEVDALLKHIESKYRLLFLLMSDAGLRRSEAMLLKVEDIDASRKTINVRGKGAKYRSIPWTTGRLESELKKTLKNRSEGYLNLNEPKKKRPNPVPPKPYHSIRKPLIRAATAAKIRRSVNHHLLRHSFLTLAAESGINPHALQQLAGHSSIETTNKIYTHVRQDFVRDEVEKIKGF